MLGDSVQAAGLTPVLASRPPIWCLPLLTVGSGAIPVLAGCRALLHAGAALGAGKMAARSGDGVFGASQLAQRPPETVLAQLGRELGGGWVSSTELGLALVGALVAVIGLCLAMIGLQLAVIGLPLALGGLRVALIGLHLTLADLPGVHLDGRLAHLERDLSGIGGSLARRHRRLAQLHRPLAVDDPTLALIQLTLVR